MEPVATTTLAAAALEFGSELLKQLPNFDEQKKQKYYETIKKYNEAVKANDENHFDGTILDYEQQLLEQISVFQAEIRSKAV